MHLETSPRRMAKYRDISDPSRAVIIQSARLVRRLDEFGQSESIFDTPEAAHALETISIAIGKHSHHRLIKSNLMALYEPSYSSAPEVKAPVKADAYWRSAAKNSRLDWTLIAIAVVIPAISLVVAVISLVFAITFIVAGEALAAVFSILLVALFSIATIVVFDWQKRLGLGVRALVDSENGRWTLLSLPFSH